MSKANRNQGSLFRKPKFIQLIERQWEGDDGKLHSSVCALADNGSVYQYTHSERAWIPLSDDICERV